MSIRDIIEAATDGCRTPVGSGDGWFVQVPTEHGGFHHSIACGLPSSDGGALSEADARFLAAFDKQHVALMEDESEAVSSLIADMALTVRRGGHPHEAFTALIACHNRVANYREGRAL